MEHETLPPDGNDAGLPELEAEARRHGLERDEAQPGTPRSHAGEFGEIASSHAAYLYAAAVRLCGDRERAKDLVQDTHLRALLHFHQFRQGTNVRAWLTTIMTRLFFDQLRHDNVVARAGRKLAAAEIIASEIDMTTPVVSDAALWNAVSSLDTDLRVVVELRYLQQLGYKQIADQLHLRVGTVGTRLMRAHERLRAFLKPHTA